MLDIAHEGHPGETAMETYVRSRLWFPKMDEGISKITQRCLACQASTVTKTRDPFNTFGTTGTPMSPKSNDSYLSTKGCEENYFWIIIKYKIRKF